MFVKKKNQNFILFFIFNLNHKIYEKFWHKNAAAFHLMPMWILK